MRIGYFIILFLSIVTMFASLIIEYIYPFIGGEPSQNLPKTILYRVLHYYIFIYCAAFFWLFEPYGFDAYLYLVFNLIMNAHWCICQCCILSYYELLNYRCDFREYSTKFHPYLFVFFRDWSETVINVVGVLILITILYIFLWNYDIPITTKILYLGLFGYSVHICSSGRSLLESNSPVSIMKREIQRIDNDLWGYPTDPESVFMKYIFREQDLGKDRSKNLHNYSQSRRAS